MSRVNPGIFRKYDIRGVAGRDLDENVAESIGRAVATLLRERPGDATVGPVAVGRDVRHTSRSLARAVMKGVAASGLDVVDLGIVPTPVVYFYLHERPCAGGVVVTGSHNPPEFNGFKVCRGRESLYGDGIQEIRRIVEEGIFSPSARRGRTRRVFALPPYLRFLRKQFGHLRSRGGIRRPVRVVVDAGNGTAGSVAPRLLRALGCEVVELYCQPDGRFPHHHPDPTVAGNLADLQSAVREAKGDLGVAYDGDGDRLGVVDERGEIVWGDRLLVLYARQVLKDHIGATCVGDVKCSQLFFDDVERRGGIPLMWRTGHSLIKAKMRETGALLAGEMSGHFYFADRYYGFDDAVYATCRLLEVLDAARKEDPEARLSELWGDPPPWVATPEMRISCPDENKEIVVRRLTERISFMIGNGAMPAELRDEVKGVSTLDGLRMSGGNGWALVRASNTEPALILRFEAAEDSLLQDYRSFVEGLLRDVLVELRIENSDFRIDGPGNVRSKQ